MRPLHLEVAESELVELRRRLRATRWAEPETVADWTQGVPRAYLQDLCAYWANHYDWRACEQRLNAIGQFTTTVDGLEIHFLHARSPRADAIPLVLTHGWPGSVLEFLEVVGPLSDPDTHGRDTDVAFHVVCPSLPGYGLSAKPAAPGWGVERIADAWVVLMARLGYESFIAQGGDWGSAVSTEIALRHPNALRGLHLNMPSAPPTSLDPDVLSAPESAALAAMGEFRKFESAYSQQHATRPQTVGYSLVDSPVGLAAWIVEKFRAWSDCDGAIENAFSRDEILDNLTLYWLSASGASSARLYWESFGRTSFSPVTVPTGCSIFPHEIYRPSRRWVAARFTNLVYWNEPARGGHFAAFEQPELFADELRRFARALGDTN